MKLTGVIYLVGLSCVSVIPSRADDGFFRVADSLTYRLMLDRISELDREVAQLRSEVDFAAGQTKYDSTTQDQLLARVAALQAEILDIKSELGDGKTFSISDDAMVSRGGQLYVPNRGAAREEIAQVSLQDALPDESDLSISGFMDAVYENNSDPEVGNSAYLNQVEVDFAKAINGRADAALGIIYADEFKVGVAQISYQVKQDREESKSLLKSWTVAAGQFDAPFGEDVVNYPSNLRKTVSIPEIVLQTHNLWNDLGVQTNFGFAGANVDAWLVRGFSLRTNANLDDPEGELHVSSGSRLNVNLSSNLRCGGSWAIGWLPNGAHAMHMYGAHGIVMHNTWSFTAEGIMLHEAAGGIETNRRGYYVQGIKELNRFFAVARADHVEGSELYSHNHLSIGGGAYLGSGLEFRTEYVADGDAVNNQLLVQVVATF